MSTNDPSPMNSRCILKNNLSPLSVPNVVEQLPPRIEHIAFPMKQYFFKGNLRTHVRGIISQMTMMKNDDYAKKWLAGIENVEDAKIYVRTDMSIRRKN